MPELLLAPNEAGPDRRPALAATPRLRRRRRGSVHLFPLRSARAAARGTARLDREGNPIRGLAWAVLLSMPFWVVVLGVLARVL
jgi:hypothetical protein